MHQLRVCTFFHVEKILTLLYQNLPWLVQIYKRSYTFCQPEGGR